MLLEELLVYFIQDLEKVILKKLAFQEIMYGLDGALTERITASSTLDTPRKFTNGFFKTTMLTQVTQLSRQMAFDGNL